MNSFLKYPFFFKTTIISIGLYVLISALYFTQSIIVPFVFSIIIAIILLPVVNFLVRRKINKIIAITFTLIFAVCVTTLIVVLLCSQASLFGNFLPELLTKLQTTLNQLVVWSSDNFNIKPEKINSWLAEISQDILSKKNSYLKETLLSAGNVLAVLILVPVYTFMILYYQPLLFEFIYRIFDSNSHNEVSEVLDAIKKIIQGYLTGLILEFIIVAILNSVGLLILGIKYAIFIGVIGSLFNIIPYIGGVIAAILPMVVAFVTKPSPSYVLLVLGVYIGIKFIDNHYIIPKVVASKVKINALVSVIVLIAGGVLWGVAGMFLSIPMTAVVKVIFDHIKSLKPWGYLLGDNMPVK